MLSCCISFKIAFKPSSLLNLRPLAGVYKEEEERERLLFGIYKDTMMSQSRVVAAASCFMSLHKVRPSSFESARTPAVRAMGRACALGHTRDGLHSCKVLRS